MGCFSSTCCCFIHESRGTVEESAQRPQCAGEGGPSAGEVRTPRGERVQEDAQRGKGRRKGQMKWTQDVGNRHHQGRRRRGRGADAAALSGRAFINNARGGPGRQTRCEEGC